MGTAYIGLFNLAFARKHGGQFILRIEDTDQERSKPQWETQICEGLRWLGLTWDEGPDVGGPLGPYRQSERKAIYQEHVQKLLDENKAYRCFTTTEELDALRASQIKNKEPQGYDRRHRNLTPEQIAAFEQEGRTSVVRMKAPIEGETVFQDRLRGEIRIANSQVDDQVILKSDGLPTYHLANVVDDHLMGITHVIRAEEWISSTPKHVMLYEAFGWKMPEFVHMPLLRNQGGSKISKRKNPVSILDYRQRGFYPPAVINYLSLLGMTMPDERELFSLDQFIEALDFDRVHLGGPTFDLEKLTWLNGRYFREVLSDDELQAMLLKEVLSTERVRAIMPLIKERIDKGEDFIEKTSFFFVGDVHPTPESMLPKKKTYKELVEAFEGYVELVDKQADFSSSALETLSKSYCEDLGWKPRDLLPALRIATTGTKASPPLYETLSVLGRALVRRRLRTAIKILKEASKAEAKKGHG